MTWLILPLLRCFMATRSRKNLPSWLGKVTPASVGKRGTPGQPMGEAATVQQSDSTQHLPLSPQPLSTCPSAPPLWCHLPSALPCTAPPVTAWLWERFNCCPSSLQSLCPSESRSLPPLCPAVPQPQGPFPTTVHGGCPQLSSIFSLGLLVMTPQVCCPMPM